MATETIRFTIAGGKQLAEALRQLPADIAGEVMETALVAGATPIRDDAAARARIRRGPRRHPEAVPLADTIRIMVRERSGYRAAVDIVTKSPTARFREFGHRMVRGGHVVGHVPAYPFLRPAADERAESSVRIIGDELGPEIENAFARRAPHEQA
jgi:hypothetical protein